MTTPYPPTNLVAIRNGMQIALALPVAALLLVLAFPSSGFAASLRPPDCGQITSAPDLRRNCVLSASTELNTAGNRPYPNPAHYDVALTKGNDGFARGSVVVTAAGVGGPSTTCSYTGVSPGVTPIPCVQSWNAGLVRLYEPYGIQASWLIDYGTQTVAGDAYPPQPEAYVGGVSRQWIGFGTLRMSFQVTASALQHDRYLIMSMGKTWWRVGDTHAATGGGGQEVLLRLPKLAPGLPVAGCTVERAPGTPPGTFRFTSTSVDPSTLEPMALWTFPDGSTSTGKVTQFRFDTAGVHQVQLLAIGPDGSTTRTCQATVQPPELTVAITTDGDPPFDAGEPIAATVRVSATGDGVGQVDQVRFTGTAAGNVISSTSDSITFDRGTPAPLPESEGFTLLAGTHRDFQVELDPGDDLGTYVLGSSIEGLAPFTSVSGAPAPVTRTAAADARGEVGTALGVEIELDPATIPEQAEDSDGPDQVTVIARVRVTNNSGTQMTDVRLLSLVPGLRVAGANPASLPVKTAGHDLGDDGYLLGDGTLDDAETIEYIAQYRADDDVEATFTALATGTRQVAGQPVGDVGVGRANWSVKPKYLLGVTTTQLLPQPGTPIPAGQAIRVRGEVENLSQTDRLKVGPLFPRLRGNAGSTSFAWNATGVDPEEYSSEGVIELAPGEKRTFTVRVATAYSDPTDADLVRAPHGGIRAELTFTPWARRIDEFGIEHDVDTDPTSPDTELRADADHLHREISVDDSIEIPTMSAAAFAGGIMYGGAKGVKNAAGAMLVAPAEGLVLFGTTLKSTWEFQERMWDSLTPGEREAFLTDVAYASSEILKRNAEYAAMLPSELFDLAYQSAETRMTNLHNAWEVGDWTQTVEVYSTAAGDTVAQVVLPVAISKMARDARVVAALARAQQELQVAFETTIGVQLSQVRRIEQLGPLLREVRSGTELRPDQLRTLYGITPEELVELQKLADRYSLLLTVRSRHASSIEWIANHGAMMKPEALKIKSVSELDSRLGYREADIGSLVFRKPEPLAQFEAAGGTGNLDGFIDAYVESKGFVLGSKDGVAAHQRMAARVEEWKKHERTYKQWSKLDREGSGFIDVSYNYVGNGIDDTVRKGTGKYVGFRLKPIPGETESYVVQLFDGRNGRWVPVTGDIDPIAFTHLDGSPLGMAQHADLLDDIARNPLLRGQHPESATFVGVNPAEHDGVKFISKQFKREPDGTFEAALQIAPGGVAPRAVRFNPKKSIWNDPRDYNLHWDGGFVYSGSYVPRGARPIPAPAWGQLGSAQYETAAAGSVRPLPQSVGGEPSLGRCVVIYSTAAAAEPLVIDADFVIAKIRDLAQGGVKSLVETGIKDHCLTEGAPPVQLPVRPSTGLTESVPAGSTRLPVDQSPASSGDGSQAFKAGQRILVGAGTPQAEEAVIVGFGSLLLLEPLRNSHAAGATILVLEDAPAAVAPPRADPPAVTPPDEEPPVLAATARPRVVGQALVGRRLTATAGRWSSAPQSFTYQWRANGRPIPGATGRRLAVRSALAGRRLSVAVTARIGERTVTSTSLALHARHASLVRVTAPRGVVRTGVRSKLVLLVRTGATRRPTGVVTVRVGSRIVRARLLARSAGRVAVTLPPLRPGRHAVRVSWAGSRLAAPATSRLITLRVR